MSAKQIHQVRLTGTELCKYMDCMTVMLRYDDFTNEESYNCTIAYTLGVK